MKKPLLNIPKPRYDYSGFKLNRIREPQYRHLLFWLFWPAFVLRYFIVENIPPLGPYHVMYCPLDDLIPFCEWFLIPYGIWFFTMLGMQLYTMFYDVKEFKRFSRFILISMSISTVTFIVYPSCQNLRPETFEHHNLLTWIMSIVYYVDTNTNVCPSEHVIGAVAVLVAAYHCKGLRSFWKLTLITFVMSLVILSTVFLKQHSVVDMIAAVPICVLAYWLSYGLKPRKAVETEKAIEPKKA